MEVNPHADESAQKICNTNYTNKRMARIKGDLKNKRQFVLFVFQECIFGTKLALGYSFSIEDKNVLPIEMLKTFAPRIVKAVFDNNADKVRRVHEKNTDHSADL